MRFWWASQGKNYRQVIPQGTLWTRPWVNGVVPVNRGLIKQLQVDDLVFHYGGGYLRAASQVVAPWVLEDRPVGYPLGPRETSVDNDGWLVRVEPWYVGRSLHWRDAAAHVRRGDQGPFSRAGVPQEKYLSELTEAESESLLAAMGLQMPSQFVIGHPHLDWASGAGATDGEGVTLVRREQSALRAHLLNGAAEAQCGFCGDSLPARLLVAAHIVRRSDLDDYERRQFCEIAVLACLLGCDALYEHAFIGVGPTGLIVRGSRRTPADGAAARLVRHLAGRRAPGWNLQTAGMFARHQARPA